MNWEQLLSLKRFGDTQKRPRIAQDETRLGFEVDFDRIIFSSAFRSLQDKTQVIPLSETDFVHTRLTHSLEVSVVGRTLGRKVGKVLLERHPNLVDLGYTFNDFGAIVAAASVTHDIGNPPFGHSGEKAIGEYFKTGNGVKYKDQLSEKEYQDLIDFEGNANGFKILTESREGISGGLRLSYATLGAFLKYPKESLPKKPTNHISDKKYGFFQSEKEEFLDVVQELGMQSKSTESHSFFRHPLAYLVEAADDICYTIIDFEDGINLGLIDEDYALEYMSKLIHGINRDKYYALKHTKDRTAYLRAIAINSLIDEAVSIFLNNEEAILNGDFDKSLLDKCKYEAQINDIIKISIDKIYRSKEVIEKEVAGYRIIADLLDVFVTALNNKFSDSQSNFDKLVLNLMPKEYQTETANLYHRIMQVCSYVSRMSDSYAIKMHKKITGNII
ncbi:deoxyguanosinetriphosphate triphosphohydrolase [Polaribacter reichenbachii]|uniref:dGTPase n=1 Tax=Polaribacter reichenbachii TaxID=996801 RepID=A0A1B8U7F4_9FLAO|nr:deoxyguanosinetriphosphate triphosphohydrolase [Polaribacter reichenbachii]APZ46453.1 deoxyguanosinetriphosphate triphosphohydrolase [Polaribacter reichenbachii]AUC20318.1 deoxyguanosinetriphosphate triphosphohydrolase [Polaribacter reichenbachii]OBY67781.1 dGTPase [Polaribacter reichenbachii]